MKATKKILILILSFLLCIIFSGCQSKEAKAVDELIASIGSVSLDSAELIFDAENRYNLLTEEEQKTLENGDTLVHDRIELNQLVESLIANSFESEDLGELETYLSSADVTTISCSSEKFDSEIRSFLEHPAEVYSITPEYKNFIQNAYRISLLYDEMEPIQDVLSKGSDIVEKGVDWYGASDAIEQFETILSTSFSHSFSGYRSVATVCSSLPALSTYEWSNNTNHLVDAVTDYKNAMIGMYESILALNETRFTSLADDASVALENIEELLTSEREYRTEFLDYLLGIESL